MLSEVCKDRIIKSKLKNLFNRLSEGTLGYWLDFHLQIHLDSLPFTKSNVMMYQKAHLINKEGQVTHETFYTMNVIDVSPSTPGFKTFSGSPMPFLHRKPVLIPPTSSPTQFLHPDVKFYTHSIPLPLIHPCPLHISNPHFSWKLPLTLMVPILCAFLAPGLPHVPFILMYQNFRSVANLFHLTVRCTKNIFGTIYKLRRETWKEHIIKYSYLLDFEYILCSQAIFINLAHINI